MEGASVAPAGAGGGAARVTVAVSLGSVEVGRNGDRQEVRAYERVAWCYDALARAYSLGRIPAAKAAQLPYLRAGERVGRIHSGRHAVAGVPGHGRVQLRLVALLGLVLQRLNLLLPLDLDLEESDQHAARNLRHHVQEEVVPLLLVLVLRVHLRVAALGLLARLFTLY